MLLTGENTRVFQMHLTARCNLRCTHCYSSSSPDERGGLPAALAKQAIRSAADLGYNTISFSGGEPLLMNDLPEIAREARTLGMHVNLVTNGMLINERRIADFAGVLDVIAISLDGVPERHNRMRGSPNAFEKMRGNLEALRASHIPFGFVFTLTTENLFEMEWAAEFAYREGAKLLQVHPLEAFGRATREHAGQDPREDVAARGWLLALRLRQIYAGRMAVEVDLANAAQPPLSSQAALQLARECSSGETGLGHFLSPLVLEPDGALAPLRYGFPRNFAFGSLKQADLKDLAERWSRLKAMALAHLYAIVLDQISRSSWPLVNLYERLSLAASAAPIALSA
jgi:MoaA/NifB/PqqE/SkfB family radical SAM enzyme